MKTLEQKRKIKTTLGVTSIYLIGQAIATFISSFIANHFDKILEEDKEDIEMGKEIKRELEERLRIQHEISMEELENCTDEDDILKELEIQYNHDCIKYRIIAILISSIISYGCGKITGKIINKIMNKE